MQPITVQLDQAFRKAIREALEIDADPLIAPSANEKFGDYQSNAAMGLAKAVAERTGQKTNPRQVAERVKEKLALGEMASEVTIAGPGFINVRLSTPWLEKRAEEVAADERLGVEKVERPQTVVVDYSGPNIAKELHVGHLRSTIIGDAIVRVLDFEGHRVIRQNHIGDWGTQFGMLITYLRGDKADAIDLLGLENIYRSAKQFFDESPVFAENSRQAVVRLQAGEKEEVAIWQRIIEKTRQHYESIYERLGVKLTRSDERGESFYNPRLPGVVEQLLKLGIAERSEGAVVVPVEGFENPLIIEKTGGGYLYGTTDLAAIRYRVGELGADRVIYFVDARQSQHFAQVFAAAKKAGWAGNASLEHASFGTMMGEDGKPFKSRTGGLVKLAELLDEAEERALKLVSEKNPELPEEQRRSIAHAVGIGAVKYSDLSKDRTSDYHFSFDKMLALDGNTGPYLQYAYARTRAIARKAAERGRAARATMKLESPFEVGLVKHVLRFGEVLELVSRELKPHHLATYLYELATKFSGFYENCPVIQSEEPLRSSRLALTDLTARTLAKGMELLGIEHPEQM